MATKQRIDALDCPPYYHGAFQGSTVTDDFSGLSGMEDLGSVDLGIPTQFRTQNDVPPWDPTNLKNDGSSDMIQNVHGFPLQAPTQSSPSNNSRFSSPQSPLVKEEHTKTPSPIRKIRGSGKVEKRKAETPGKFVIMTPNLINAQSGKPNPFECFEAMRTTQRGRKGPLANETKESALQVRRLGACFCCHSRKVKVSYKPKPQLSLALLTPWPV